MENQHIYESIAAEYSTPTFVYDGDKIVAACRAFVTHVNPTRDHVCYAVKANNNLSVLKTIFHQDLGADVVSVGELERAVKAGCAPEKIVFSGVGKRSHEIERGLSLGILSFNVESTAELDQIERVAATLKKTAQICLRVNPNIDVKTNPYIATGLYETKFGIAETDLASSVEKIRSLKHVRLIGLACHLGSQIVDIQPMLQAAERMVFHAKKLKSDGQPLEYVNIGGGLGIRYDDEECIDVPSYVQKTQKIISEAGFRAIYEPGRVIVGNAGVLLSRVVGVKKSPKKTFIVVDAAMTELIRPALYEAFHGVEVLGADPKKTVTADIVGPVCETGDFIALDRVVCEPREGDLVVIKSAGAYGMSMSSHYNTRPRAAEILLKGGEKKLIRRREHVEELWQAEIMI